MKHLLIKHVVSTAVTLGLGLVVGLGVAASRQQGVPVVITDMHEADGVAARGGMIDLVLKTQRNRFCPSETQRWIWRWIEIDGQKARQFVPLVVTGAAPVAGDGWVMLSIPVPSGMQPGDWFYRSITVERCSWLPAPFRPGVWQTPDIAVKVVQ